MKYTEEQKIIQGYVHRFAVPAVKVPRNILQDNELRDQALRYAIDHGMINTKNIMPHLRTRKVLGRHIFAALKSEGKA